MREETKRLAQNSRTKATPEVLATMDALLEARDAAKSNGSKAEYRNAWNAASRYAASNLPQKTGGRCNRAGRTQYNARRLS